MGDEIGVFEATIVNRTTGDESKTELRARDVEEARAKLAAMGAIAGKVQFVRFESSGASSTSPMPVHQRVDAGSGGRNSVQTVEQTGKEWKILQLIGVLLILGWPIGLLIGGLTGLPIIGGVSVLAVLVGIIVYVYARVGAWWNHG